MARFGVGIMHSTINSRFGPTSVVHDDYAAGMACGADSFWVANHINSAWPPSIWKPEHVGAVQVIPKIIDQMADFRDHGLRYLVCGNAGAIEPSLRKSATATASYVKVVRALRKL